MASGKTCWQLVDYLLTTVAPTADRKYAAVGRQIERQGRTDDGRVINGFSPPAWFAQLTEATAVTATARDLVTTTEFTKTTTTEV
jgi:hypothetical protein